MKLTIPTIGVLASVIVLASIGVLYTLAYESTNLSLTGSTTPAGAALMTGNVKVTHFNEHGEVIGYRQGSNHITATGMAIIMAQVFSGINQTQYTGDSPGTGAGNNVTGRVGWMEIGTDGDTPSSYTNKLRYNNTDLITPVENTVNTCLRERATITNSTTVGAVAGDFRLAHEAGSFCNTPQLGKSVDACSARANVTAIAQFDGADCATLSIDEAGIFTTASQADDNANGHRGLMFARNTFGSVNLGALDTLQLEWEFTFTDS